jgi:hypothetical protein
MNTEISNAGRPRGQVLNASGRGRGCLSAVAVGANFSEKNATLL